MDYRGRKRWIPYPQSPHSARTPASSLHPRHTCQIAKPQQLPTIPGKAWAGVAYGSVLHRMRPRTCRRRQSQAHEPQDTSAAQHRSARAGILRPASRSAQSRGDIVSPRVALLQVLMVSSRVLPGLALGLGVRHIGLRIVFIRVLSTGKHIKGDGVRRGGEHVAGRRHSPASTDGAAPMHSAARSGQACFARWKTCMSRTPVVMTLRFFLGVLLFYTGFQNF